MYKYLCICLQVFWKCFTFASIFIMKITVDYVTSYFSFT